MPARPRPGSVLALSGGRTLAFPRPRRPGGCGRRRVPRNKRGERGARLLPRERRLRAKRQDGKVGTAVRRVRRTPRATLLVPGPATSAAQPLPVDGRLKCVRTDPGFSPGRARPPPGCRAARLVAPETGRRRTLRHRLARTGSAPHQPQPASRPKPPPRASRTCSREPARSPSAMPPHVTTPHERAPLPGGMGHIRTKCDRRQGLFSTSPERERSSRREARPGEGPTLRGGACSAFCPAAGALIPAPHPVRRPLRTSVRRRFAAASCAGSRIAFHCASLRSRLPGKGWLEFALALSTAFPGACSASECDPGPSAKLAAKRRRTHFAAASVRERWNAFASRT